MLFTTNKFISCLLSLLLLQISISVKPKKILTDEEKLKKGFFLDSYAISQSQIYLHTNFSKEIEKEKNIKRKLTETEITLTDVGFHNYDTNHPYAAYTNIFSNIGKDKSKYILYPYGFKYKNKNEDGSESEEKFQSKGGFFSLKSTLFTPSLNIISNISSVKISKSKALYDIDIGIFTYETKVEGIPRDLFSEANFICNYFVQSIPKVSDCAHELSELQKYRKSKPNKGSILMINPTILKDKNFQFKKDDNNFQLLIIPDHVIETEDLIIKAWGEDGVKKIKDFVTKGGNILATGKSGYILEKIGLISNGLYKTDKFLYYQDSSKNSDNALVTMTGCENVDTKTPLEQPDFFKQMICLNRKYQVYLSSSYAMSKEKMEEKKELDIIMSLNPTYIGDKLKYKLLDGNDGELGTDNYFPLVLTKQESNKGKIIIINGNLSPNSGNTYRLMVDPIFYSMGKNIVFDAYVKYSDGMEEDTPIPGGEEGIRISCFFKFLNLFDTPVKDITVDIFTANKTKFTDVPTGCILKENDKKKYFNLTDMDMTSYIQCTLSELQKYSEFSKEIVIEITDQSVTQKATDIALFYPLLEFTDFETNERINIDYGAVTVTAALSAILRVTANSEPPGDYPVFGYGNYLDQVFNVENKENTIAKNINLITVIPLVSLLVNDIRENSVVHTLKFYDQYYKDHNYKYPFTKTLVDVDYIDYAELSDKGIIFDNDFDEPVKYIKVERNDLKKNNLVDNLYEPSGNVKTNVDENNLLKTNSQMLLKELCYHDADIFYEVADFRRFVFIDTSTKEGAQTYYNGNIPEEEKDPADPTRAKIEIPFARVDFYFESDPNYQVPTNITDDMAFTIDKYKPEPIITTDREINNYTANISKVGSFNSEKNDGKLIEDEFYNVLKQHTKIKKFINPLKPGYNITEDFPDIKVSHYLVLIPGTRIQRAGSIKGFIEEETGNDYKHGYLEEYPEVKFIYAHSVRFNIAKNLTRLGGKLIIDLGTSTFKNDKLPEENDFVTLSVDGVAVYKIEYDYVKGVKNIITAYFKRGLMPDEICGKDSPVELNVENLTSPDSINAVIELYELKYDLSKKENNFESYAKVESFVSNQILTYEKFWSMPCLIINNKFERYETDSIKEYELLDPYARYTLYYQELLKHRTIYCNSLSDQVTNPGIQTPFSSYGLISNIGIVSIPFSDYVDHPALIIPAASSTSRIEWEDIWGRNWAQPIRSIFPDFLPLPYVAQNFMMSTTYEVIQNGQRVLEWDATDSAYVMIHIKFLNNYFKYVNLAICKANQNITGKSETDFVEINHLNAYGKCYQDTNAFLNGTKITEDIIAHMDEAMLCPESDNALEMMQCSERIKNLDLPLLIQRDSKVKLPPGYKWNYSPLVDNYYPKGYLDEEIMWDMTKKEYAFDVYFKGYPWNYDNTLPGFDHLADKAENLMAFPIFKGFGYKMDYSPNNTVPNRYNNMKGWWSDNLQNKDNTLLAGQPYVNINPTINKTILTDDYWINGKLINSEEVQKKLKNIYVCQFNQHRIKVDPKKNTQFILFRNIYQNNIIPIYPELDDDNYKNYDCSNQYQYNSTNISTVDNRIRTNNDRDWLYFALNLRAEAKETLNIILTLDPFSDRQYEGETKINDGGRFTYWNPALTKNGYIYLDNNVNVIRGFRVDLLSDVAVFPKDVNTFKVNNYHLFTLEDKKEELREYKMTTYTNSYGFGDSVVMINIGGIKDSDCRIRPGQSTYIKITFFNNAGFDWNLKGDAMEAANFKSTSDILMKEKKHSIQKPTKYNFLELEIPEQIKDYVDIVPSDHNENVTAQFFDFECINLATIRDGFKGEYYYKLTLKEGLDEKYFGRFWEIKVNLKYEYFDVLPGSPNDPVTKVKDGVMMKHDYSLKVPSIKFGIPYPSNYKIPEYRNKVFYTIGRASNLSISYNFPDEFNLDDIKIVSEEEVEKIREASLDTTNFNEKLLDIWNNGIANKSSYLTGEIGANVLEPSDGLKRIWIYLNKSFPEFPYEIYGEPDRTKINILVKISAPQVSYGKKLGVKWGYGQYNDSLVLRKTNTGLAAYITATGPWMKVDIDYTLLKYNKSLDDFIEEENQNFVPMKGYMKLKITALNAGNKNAYQTSYKYVFSKYVIILENYGDMLDKKDILKLAKNNTSGETILYVNSNREIPQNTKDAYNIYIRYEFDDITAINSILVKRNLAENDDRVIVKNGDVTLCQDNKCENDESLVNQFIKIDFKISSSKIIEADDIDEVPGLFTEKSSSPESKSKGWIIGVIIAIIVLVALGVYLFIDYKKKLWIFKSKESNNIAISDKVDKPRTNDTNNAMDNIETISVTKRKRSVQNQSKFAPVNMVSDSKNN